MERISFSNQDMSYAVREELKTLRTNIQFCGDDKRVILVTSCLAGEGKSTMTQELAQTLSEIDKRVLYIDADLRKERDDKSGLEGSFEYGLTHYLIGQCTSRECIYSTDVRGLYVIPSGQVPPNPSELLANERMQVLISEMKEVFDYVIIDTAPLGMVVDAADRISDGGLPAGTGCDKTAEKHPVSDPRCCAQQSGSGQGKLLRIWQIWPLWSLWCLRRKLKQ